MASNAAVMRPFWIVPLVPCVAFFACGRSRVPDPEYGDHPRGANEAMCVPYPPPAAKPEETGAPPSDRAVWIDGDWIWKGQGSPTSTVGKWEWKPGAWVDPPFDASYSKSVLLRMRNGALAWYPPHWHLPEHYDLPVAAPSAAGSNGPLPKSSSGLALTCPDPAPNETTGLPLPLGDAGSVHAGPALLFPADAPAKSPPKIVMDALIPSDAKESPTLIQPP